MGGWELMEIWGGIGEESFLEVNRDDLGEVFWVWRKDGSSTLIFFRGDLSYFYMCVKGEVGLCYGGGIGTVIGKV